MVFSGEIFIHFYHAKKLCLLLEIQRNTNNSRTGPSRFLIAHGKGLDPNVFVKVLASKYLTPFTVTHELTRRGESFLPFKVCLLIITPYEHRLTAVEGVKAIKPLYACSWFQAWVSCYSHLIHTVDGTQRWESYQPFELCLPWRSPLPCNNQGT